MSPVMKMAERPSCGMVTVFSRSMAACRFVTL